MNDGAGSDAAVTDVLVAAVALLILSENRIVRHAAGIDMLRAGAHDRTVRHAAVIDTLMSVYIDGGGGGDAAGRDVLHAGAVDDGGGGGGVLALDELHAAAVDGGGAGAAAGRDILQAAAAENRIIRLAAGIDMLTAAGIDDAGTRAAETDMLQTAADEWFVRLGFGRGVVAAQAAADNRTLIHAAFRDKLPAAAVDGGVVGGAAFRDVHRGIVVCPLVVAELLPVQRGISADGVIANRNRLLHPRLRLPRRQRARERQRRCRPPPAVQPHAAVRTRLRQQAHAARREHA